ncbi:GNAT family N-acetyltransferase [Phycicoccus endophyticus]|uniref:GNAT family N-acetyltransferase n=1 Tax=Phycicoccus endophyticus TaxID=1690220 RepID=A0A7G9R2J1_9MICO|nr:GNAT family N-acetyltransferase [Phycicoccus endophyticus]NHI20726.1 GNAT family N-acetyltransferase [Phycicoccus endophyticus]QNN49816.1 GNAT family N-acetyltransferase [Phycicoccus endophyticus]GGL35360.1 hypothetical protein GCM10012283_17270 [Phycicoccus endophyticus]
MPELVPVSGLDIDPTAANRFDAWAGVLADAARHDEGEDHDAWTAQELRGLEGDTTARRLQVLATVDGDPVGAAGLVLPLLDNQHAAMLVLAVHPAHRRRGDGGALLAWAEEQARAAGRTTAYTETRWSGGRDDDGHAPFALAHGYLAAQTVLRSDLDVATATGSAPSAPSGYRVETHVDAMPDADLADRAVLARRMSTDTPLGDLELGEEAWDEERVRGEDERAGAMGRRVVASFARDLRSGRLVGYTALQVPRGAPALAYQQDTLVLREHRGRGLGLALKAAALAAVVQELPEVRRVRTWNAVENTHMLAVNAAQGYRASGYLREWHKPLG